MKVSSQTIDMSLAGKEGIDVEPDEIYPVTGWYLEGFGIPPFPVPTTDIQIEGARLLSMENLEDIFADDHEDPPKPM